MTQPASPTPMGNASAVRPARNAKTSTAKPSTSTAARREGPREDELEAGLKSPDAVLRAERAPDHQGGRQQADDHHRPRQHLAHRHRGVIPLASPPTPAPAIHCGAQCSGGVAAGHAAGELRLFDGEPGAEIRFHALVYRPLGRGQRDGRSRRQFHREAKRPVGEF